MMAYDRKNKCALNDVDCKGIGVCQEVCFVVLFKHHVF